MPMMSCQDELCADLTYKVYDFIPVEVIHRHTNHLHRAKGRNSRFLVNWHPL